MDASTPVHPFAANIDARIEAMIDAALTPTDHDLEYWVAWISRGGVPRSRYYQTEEHALEYVARMRRYGFHPKLWRRRVGPWQADR